MTAGVDAVARGLAVVVLALGAAGCGWGYVYTNITTPLDTNLTANERPPVTDELSTKTFQYVVRVDWGTNAIGDIAKQYGIETVHYADLEQTYVWFGLWRQAWVHIYGEGRPPPR